MFFLGYNKKGRCRFGLHSWRPLARPHYRGITPPPGVRLFGCERCNAREAWRIRV